MNQKALNVWHKANGVLENIRDAVELLNFDPRSLGVIKDQIVGGGLNLLITAVTQQPIDIDLRIPPAMLQRMQKVMGVAYKVLGHEKVQEFMGEMATALIIHLLGFEQPEDFELDSVNGPDQVARQSATGTSGIFEAKGGTSRLSTGASYGDQMRGPWITHWITELTRRNGDTEFGRDLDRAYQRETPMIAAVTRLNLNHTVEFKVTAQRYSPPEGRNMDPWGSGW